MNVQDVKTPEDLEEWVRQRAANIDIYSQYLTAMTTCRSLVAVQYPGRKFDWPTPTLQPCHADIEGVKRNIFVHWYEFPDGFKTGVLVVMGTGEHSHLVTSIVFADPSNEIIRG